MRRILLLLSLLTLCACGRKGALVPPEALAPAAINNLQVTQKGEAFQVSWSAPSRQQGGGRLTDLSGFVLMRHEVLPEGEDCDACATAYGTIANVDLEYLRNARRVGNTFVYNDHDITMGKTYRYKARAVKLDGTQSTDSNKPQRMAVPPPAAPSLEVVPGATGMTLNFSGPQLREGTLLGYNIYRHKAGEDPSLTPLNAAPVKGPHYEDQVVQHGVRYLYTVRAVIQVGDVIVEGASSPEVPGTLLESEYP